MYTREKGAMSVLIKGMRQRKSGKHNVYFQPFFILDMEVYNKDARGVQLMKEFTPLYIPNGIQENIEKTCVALFIGELLSSIFRNEEKNVDLYDYIDNSVRYLDTCEHSFSNYHIVFITKLFGFLGIEPNQPVDGESLYFDMANGRFNIMPPPHGAYADEEVSMILAKFFTSSFDEAMEIKMNGVLRNRTLDTLIKFASIHTPILREVKSLDVMREIFG